VVPGTEAVETEVLGTEVVVTVVTARATGSSAPPLPNAATAAAPRNGATTASTNAPLVALSASPHQPRETGISVTALLNATMDVVLKNGAMTEEPSALLGVASVSETPVILYCRALMK